MNSAKTTKTFSQSALEYLMTYGWALIVLIAIVLGLVFVLSPSTIQPQMSCDARIGKFTVSSESTLKQDSLELILTNHLEREVSNLDFTVSGESNGSLNDQGLERDETKKFTIPLSPSVSGEFILQISVSYDTANVSAATAKAECRGRLS